MDNDTKAVGSEPVIRCRSINKFFGGVRALADVSLDVLPAQVVALVGDNGAGKSTLARVIGGLERHDSGELYYGDELIKRSSPVLAYKHGIQSVPQGLALCENLSAAENILLGRQPVRFGVWPFHFIDKSGAAELAGRQLAQVGIQIPDLNSPIRRLSGGQRQAIAIARAMVQGHRLIMFDEPTAALGVRQRAATLNLVRGVAARGLAALVISHNVDDVFSVADRVVALRLGRVVLDSPIPSTDKATVIQAMEGLTDDVVVG